MFNNLSEKFTSIINSIRGKGRITEADLNHISEEIYASLLDADVAMEVAKQFISAVKQQVLAAEFANHLNPSQQFIKIMHQQLTLILGADSAKLNLRSKPPVVILLAGLQGSGKTTTCIKLAKFIKQTHKKRALVVSTDTQRPAAMEQLANLATSSGIDYHQPELAEPLQITKAAMGFASKHIYDILIIDTAGRMHVDTSLMDELQAMVALSKPTELLFVVDSMTGQDAAITAKKFNDNLALTGIILSKTDGDSRGGSALSMRHIIQKPIKFIGVGEKVADLEEFHPDRIAKRILDMGDMLSIIEDAEKQLSSDSKSRLRKGALKGKAFNFNDLQEQIKQVSKLGGLDGLLSKLPGGMSISKQQLAESRKNLKRTLAIIDSMTVKERKFPKLLDASRKKRIAAGSGTSVMDINQIIKQLGSMHKMMKKVKNSKTPQRFL